MGAIEGEKKKKTRRMKSKQSKAPRSSRGLRGSIQVVQAHIQVLHCPSIKQALWSYPTRDITDPWGLGGGVTFTQCWIGTKSL